MSKSYQNTLKITGIQITVQCWTHISSFQLEYQCLDPTTPQQWSGADPRTRWKLMPMSVCWSPKNTGALEPAPLGWGIDDPKKHATPHKLLYQIQSLLVKWFRFNHTWRDQPEVLGPLYSALQGYSRLTKTFTKIDWYDFLTMGLSRTVSMTKGDFGWNMQIFPSLWI